MLNPGFITRKALAEWQNAPVFLPQFQFHEKHRTVIRTASPENILPFIATFDVQQDAVIRKLMSLRQFPQKFLHNQQAHATSSFGLHSFTLLKSSATELCYGLRGQFWRVDFGLEDVPDASAFQAPIVPGSAKLLLRYQVSELTTDQHELCTETFIYCPDRTTQLKMAAYWLAIRAGSGWIRKRMLEAVKSNLEGLR
ncbi:MULTISPECIES: hypothetical protein [Enterobacter]|uniref:hypothetical protein n=1 Tax=Enterobacter TaxID=547 RepID=UPI0028E2533E|nr:hypothetical protein [Enterobacter cloacae]HDR2788904.1 hypothetical protein [Enterobacter asburiae]WNT38450.1 hypothetical protein RRL13_10240 [Enterobacter cloacae]HDR2791759.1 hypothetical protein [Enterobacter asburiae]HDR2796700.1 hypothetical protein [Enterobacter asburiae]HDR2797166.1 hypothetical protein [Enterobacter asburiae]